VFDRVQMLFRRRHLYRQVFGTPEGRAVLDDLFRFCRVGQPVIAPGDQITTGFNDGMRRVALRIAKLTNMTDAEIMRMVNQPEEVLDAHE
jgi:hypothetical protein